ncbi:glycosyltransferase family 2 protein [Gimesia maris]|uniref:glycosyltransferase family 2 protein n=1 Tax=Gimesia maris TaxID=122 RepID=UPI003A94632A
MTSTSSEPTVTFVVLTYNQERYIENAIKSAFSQTYSPLEILISDDCSTDKTFEIARRLVDEYEGPHLVRLNRNRKNLGIGGHISKISELANGSWIFLAAGDDVSMPERTEHCMGIAGENPDIFAVACHFSLPPEYRTGGHTDNYTRKVSGRVTRSEMITFQLLAHSGNSMAYRSECFHWPNKFPSETWHEDRVLPFRAALLGTCIVTDRLLVQVDGYDPEHRPADGVRIRKESRFNIVACQACIDALKVARKEQRIGPVAFGVLAVRLWALKTTFWTEEQAAIANTAVKTLALTGIRKLASLAARGPSCFRQTH